MKKIIISTALAATLALTSCTSITPITASSGTVGVKKGTSTARYLFGWLPLQLVDDTSILKASTRGDIQHIATVDAKTYVFPAKFLPLYSSKTTIVTGD